MWLKLLIETGNYVDDDQYWRYYLVYEKDSESGLRKFAGLLNFYEFNMSIEKKRLRVSQAFVLPPF